jgi:hypothetical protein
MKKEKLLKHWKEVTHSFEHLVKVALPEHAFQREWKLLKKFSSYLVAQANKSGYQQNVDRCGF